MSAQRAVLDPTVAIVGGGPAGLSAAIRLRRLGIDRVLVLEREAEAGGIPRHSDHTGYGLRDYRSLMSGPSYARRLVQEAREWRVDVRTSTMVTGWAGDVSLMASSREGRVRVDAEAIVLATGARERPRPARMIPGDRPSGVLTTGHLQNLVHGQREGAVGTVGLRAVIVGAELVSWSAALTLREAGCTTVLMTTEYDRPESPTAFTVPGRLLLRVPLSCRTRLTRIIGRERVEAVEIEQVETGLRRIVECDTVVLTGDWIPDSELSRLRGLDMDSDIGGPLVDTSLRTSGDGIFAAGNLLHPVDTADVASLDGRHVAEQVVAALRGAERPLSALRLVAGAGFAWVSPGLVRSGDPAPARDRLLLWPTESRRTGRVVATQGGVTIARKVLPWPVSPGRVFRIPSSILRGARPGAGDVCIALG